MLAVCQALGTIKVKDEIQKGKITVPCNMETSYMEMHAQGPLNGAEGEGQHHSQLQKEEGDRGREPLQSW